MRISFGTNHWRMIFAKIYSFIHRCFPLRHLQNLETTVKTRTETRMLLEKTEQGGYLFIVSAVLLLF